MSYLHDILCCIFQGAVLKKVMDRQTDRRTGQKQYVSSPKCRGDIISKGQEPFFKNNDDTHTKKGTEPKTTTQRMNPT